LVNLVDREVLRVDVGLQLGLERCTDASQTIPRNAAEEWVLLDLAGTADAAKAVVGVTNQAKEVPLVSN
jgi:hypothetical protein